MLAMAQERTGFADMPHDAPAAARTGDGLGKDLPLLRNPFHLLGVSTRDGRQRIIEAADAKALSLDGDVCARARADLAHPRNRLAAELAWLPGVSTSDSGPLIERLVQDPAGMFTVDGVPALSHANLMASAILALAPGLPESDWVSCIIAFSKAVEQTSAVEVLAAVNEDRAAAGFAEIKAVAMIEEGLAERRRELRDCLRDALDRLPPRKLARVASIAAEVATRGGKAHPPALIDGMIDVYAVGTHAFLIKETANIKLLISRGSAAAAYGAATAEPFLQWLEQVVRNWHSVARPIQVLAGAKGISHGLSKDTAHAVREFAIAVLCSRLGLLEPARRVTQLIKETFGLLPEIAERADDDIHKIDELIRRRPPPPPPVVQGRPQ
jgi:hypothetical protein